MKVTKTAKKIKIELEQHTFYRSIYTCPACKIQFKDGTLRDNVISFYCSCGQKLTIQGR
jgi:hypothetical protein